MMNSSQTPGIALITGAASGIGKDTAFAFAQNGATGIALADINKDGVDVVAEECKKYAIPQTAILSLDVDVTNEESVQVMMDAVLKKFGRINYFVHSAGIAAYGNNFTSGLSIVEYEALMEVNVKGTLLCNNAVSKAMMKQNRRTYSGRNGERDIGRGSIVNLGSMLSLAVLPGKISYAASKHAVNAVMKTTAVELGPHGINVNMLCPTWVDTPILQLERARNPSFDAFIQKVVPCGRIATPDEAADVIVFLCSPAASYMSGTSIIVDNGLSLTARIASAV